jgi:hypothetical protein
MQKLLIILFLICACLLNSVSTHAQKDHSVKLKAILIVGHQEDGTKEAISDMDKIADLFTQNGVFVYKYYDNDANWNEIINVSKSCSFFVYSGHGSRMGKNGNAGGICINPTISTSELIASLRLRDNSLVIFKSVCFGAGSSAGDDNDIGIVEAKKRVSSYSYPFFKVGASGYYANNYGNGAYNFLSDFLSGITLKQAYLNSAKIWADVEFEAPFPGYKGKSFSIASTQGGRTATRTTYSNGVKKVEEVKSSKGYGIAYVGNSEFSIKEMR